MGLSFKSPPFPNTERQWQIEVTPPTVRYRGRRPAHRKKAFEVLALVKLRTIPRLLRQQHMTRTTNILRHGTVKDLLRFQQRSNPWQWGLIVFSRRTLQVLRMHRTRGCTPRKRMKKSLPLHFSGVTSANAFTPHTDMTSSRIQFVSKSNFSYVIVNGGTRNGTPDELLSPHDTGIGTPTEAKPAKRILASNLRHASMEASKRTMGCLTEP